MERPRLVSTDGQRQLWEVPPGWRLEPYAPPGDPNDSYPKLLAAGLKPDTAAAILKQIYPDWDGPAKLAS
jgi:hypothetical protein